MAARKESAPIPLTADVLHDAFGDAVVDRDVADAVKYEADAEGYVTEYERNAQGDVTLRLRYANQTTLIRHGYVGISAETVAAAVNAAAIDHGGDRGVVTRDDRLGRAIETRQSQIDAYDSSAAAGAQYFTSNKLTRTDYDAFGRVDALGYVTTLSYDWMGNKTSVREYATAATAWNAQGYGLSAAHANDRLTTYTFDALGRKVAKTRVNAEYSSPSNGTIQRGGLKTTFGYDALGNTVLTVQHANGAASVQESGYTADAASSQDRYRYAGYDSRGTRSRRSTPKARAPTIPTTRPT